MKMESSLKDIVYSRFTVEFVTVANEFCSFVEKAEDQTKDSFISKALNLLSFLYLKANLLPDNEQINEEGNEKFVTEFDWQYIRSGILNLMGDDDNYLDFYNEEMNETPEPVNSSISENIADIYQDIKDFLSIYKLGAEELSNDAIFECKTSFRDFWGFKLLNSLRILHYIQYKLPETERPDIMKTHNTPDITKWLNRQAQKGSRAND
jgi:hypothetical protein